MGKEKNSEKNEKEHKKDNKGRKTGTFRILWVIIFVITIGIAVTSEIFYRSLESQLFSERQSHLTEMTIKITEVIDVTIESLRDKADSTKSILMRNEVNMENVTSELASIADALALDGGLVLAMDNQGKYYSSDGSRGRWSYVEDLVAESSDTVIRDVAIGGKKQSCMVFMDPLEEKKTLGDGVDLTYVAVLIPMDNIKEYLTISMFGDECYTYLISSDGRRLYKQTFSERFIEDFNVISALREDAFINGGDVNDLINAVENREQLCVEFQESESGENYFISTVPVSSSEWTVLLFVPTDVLGVKSGRFMNSVVRYFGGITIAMAIAIGCIIFVVIRNSIDKKIIRQQEKNNRMLTYAVDEARHANEAKSEFLSHMSHDIRTPINGIIGMTSIAIKNKGNQERIDDCLHKISGAADHLLTLVNDVLDMSSIESGNVTIAHEQMDIRLIINNCVSIIDGQLMSRKVNFVKNIENFNHPYVYGDELHLRQVFINILGNAVKFTPDEGVIELKAKELKTDGDKVTYRFEFRDTGIGISEEFQKKIFDEFSQENETARSTYQGTGLGMAISKNFVELMGGTIAVESKLGEGSCFTVEMEFDIDYEPRTEINHEKLNQLEGMKVLLVEDNELNMEISRELLHEEGVEITEAVNGKEALDKFTSMTPGTVDAIIMDVMMPVMNGYDATRAIRSSAHPEAKTIPIIAMTANAYREDVEKALDAGMNAHVSKPINVDALVAALSQYKRN
jgi:signal transduction histidine kinase/ActR/RegA family two-component response regulator